MFNMVRASIYIGMLGLTTISAKAADLYRNLPTPPALETFKMVDCAVTAAVGNHYHFLNAGFYANPGSTAAIIPQCNWHVETTTDVYVFDAAFLPFQNFRQGGENDVGVGVVKKFGNFAFNVRAVDYYFGVGSSGQIINALNFRAKASYTFDLGEGLSLEPYGMYDAQRGTTHEHFRTDAVVGGATLSAKFSALPGRPTLGVTGEVWKFEPSPSLPSTNRPVLNLATSLGFQLWNTGCVGGPKAGWSWGNVTVPSGQGSHDSYGVFTNCPLN